MKFSIIVPCYNVELYLDECIQSILSQSYRDFEVIMIDDGSTDHTHEKCEQWHNRDERIKLVTKENGGLSSARNTGIGIAQGDYIVFVDSDDTIEKESLYQFNRYLTDETDVLITRLMENNKTNIKELDERLVDMDGKELNQYDAIDWNMNKSEATWPSVKSIVARKLINKESLRFKEGIIDEDIDWTAHLYCVAQNYKCCGYQWYSHRMARTGSIGKTITPKHIVDTVGIAWSYIYGEQKKVLDMIDQQSQKWVQERLMRSVYSSLSHYKQLDNENKQRVIECLQEHKRLFRITPAVKYKLFATAMNLLGTRSAMKIYEVIS